jgi:hypothetical protein
MVLNNFLGTLLLRPEPIKCGTARVIASWIVVEECSSNSGEDMLLARHSPLLAKRATSRIYMKPFSCRRDELKEREPPCPMKSTFSAVDSSVSLP